MISAHATTKATNPLAILEAALRGSAAGGDNTAATVQSSSQPASFLALLMQRIPGTILPQNGAATVNSQNPPTEGQPSAKKKKEQDPALVMTTLLSNPLHLSPKTGATPQTADAGFSNIPVKGIITSSTIQGQPGYPAIPIQPGVAAPAGLPVTHGVVFEDTPPAVKFAESVPLPGATNPALDPTHPGTARLPRSLPSAPETAALATDPESISLALPAQVAGFSPATPRNHNAGDIAGSPNKANPAAEVKIDAAGTTLDSQNQKSPLNALGKSNSSPATLQSPPDGGAAAPKFTATGSPNVPFLGNTTSQSVVTSAQDLDTPEIFMASNAVKRTRPSETPSATPVSSPNALAGAGQAYAASSPVEATKTPAPSALADQIQAQASAHFDQLKQTGRVDVRFDLHPPELGRVGLHLSLEDGRMNVRMTVQDDSVKRTVDQQMEPLRARLSAMGVSVGQFDVRRDGNAPNQNQQRAPEPSAQTAQADENGPAKFRKSYTPSLSPRGLVDLMA